MRNIKIRHVGSIENPKNYSKKGTICSCLCFISYENNILDKNIQVSYEVIPNMDRISLKYGAVTRTRRSRSKQTITNWGTFKQIIELPKIFDKLNDDDFIIKVGYFTRDKVEMPAVSSIQIINLQKYQILKKNEDRKKKLIKISNI